MEVQQRNERKDYHEEHQGHQDGKEDEECDYSSAFAHSLSLRVLRAFVVNLLLSTGLLASSFRFSLSSSSL
jgi:hypothetical protein